MTDSPWRIFRAFIDTNILISAFINPFGPPAAILAAVLAGRIVPVVSNESLTEVRNVLSRDRVRRRLRYDDMTIHLLLARFEAKAAIVYPRGETVYSRDPKDDVLIEMALLGKAEYIVSRDDDMKRDLDLIGYLHEAGVEVVSVAQFLAILDAS